MVVLEIGNSVDSNGNDTNWDTQGWSATIGNDGTATAEITLDRVIKKSSDSALVGRWLQ